MNKRLLLAVHFLLVATMVCAVPAKRGVKKILTLKDGTKVEASLKGDEHVHFFMALDGRALQLKSGAYEEVDPDSLQEAWELKLSMANTARRVKSQAAQKSTSYTGTKKGLVILVNFTDLEFQTDQSEWENYFNQEGYNTAGMGGSVRDYFLEQSYGALTIDFDVMGPVTVSNTYAYYGSGNEYNATAMVKEACELIDDQVDFSDYDWDGDGEVDQVYVVYAGYAESQGADESTIWPHEWTISGAGVVSAPTLDGVKIDTYACSCELNGTGSETTITIDGIGTACHEFSHCLGLPDFYDTSTSGTNYGMDVWSLLDYGCYNDDGYVPAAYTAYERAFAGWLEYKELSQPTSVANMPCLTDEPVAYVIYNDADENEYYLLQNIQQKGFNSEAFGHGLLIMHVDYDEAAWAKNTVNNSSSHQRMTIFAADNTYRQYGTGASGDPFPGTSSVTSFTDSTTPAATLYNANSEGTYYMGKAIEDIVENDSLIDFNFMGGSDKDTPVATDATDVAAGCFTANWTAVDGATMYEVSLTAVTDDGSVEPEPWDNVMIAEDFEGCYAETTTSTTDISSSLDNYLTDSGWTGEYLYASKYYLRIGRTVIKGTVQTPDLGTPSTNVSTISFLVCTGSSRSSTASIYVMNEDGVKSSSSFTISASQGTWWVYTMSVDGWYDEGYYVGLTSSTAYLGGLYVFDGEFDHDEIWGESSSSAKRKAFIKTLGLDESQFGGIVDLGTISPASSSSAMRKVAVTSKSTYTTTDNYYTFTGLEAGTYTYKVRAIYDDEYSNWSNSITVEIEGAEEDAIEVVSADGTTSNADASLYDLSGRRIKKPTGRGIYIRGGRKFVW